MRQQPSPFSLLLKAGSLLMMAALLWLTVSLPVVARAQRLLAAQERTGVPVQQEEEDGSNPLTGATEEKTPSPNTLSEYLHEIAQLKHPVGSLIRTFIHSSTSLYLAYHGELLVPPPNC